MGHHNGKREKSRMLRIAVLAASVTVALCCGGRAVAAAQSSSASVLSQQPELGLAAAPAGPIPAPVGHRQPRQEDLPPSVLRDERGGGPQDTTTGQGFSDPSLTICRKC